MQIATALILTFSEISVWNVWYQYILTGHKYSGYYHIFSQMRYAGSIGSESGFIYINLNIYLHSIANAIQKSLQYRLHSVLIR
jgi:hypothetical protein